MEKGVRKSKKLLLADQVLEAVNRQIAESKDGGFVVSVSESAYAEAYCNGREQGLCINYRLWSIAFSESRGADDIVVYSGEGFSAQGNCPHEAEYRDAYYFAGDNKIERAAEHIVAILNGRYLVCESRR